MRDLARDLAPTPLSMVLFGSLARGDPDAATDIDILAVGPADDWRGALAGQSGRIFRPSTGAYRQSYSDTRLRALRPSAPLCRPVSRADAAVYLAKSRNWLEASRESLAVKRWDVATGSAVTAAPMSSADAPKAVELAGRLPERAAAILGRTSR